MIRWIVLGCLALTACAEPGDAEGDHLLVHLTCTNDFDSMIATLDRTNMLSVTVGQLTQKFDWDDWWVFEGEGATDVAITVLSNDDAVATGHASSIVYLPQADGTRLAEITMPLTP